MRILRTMAVMVLGATLFCASLGCDSDDGDSGTADAAAHVGDTTSGDPADTTGGDPADTTGGDPTGTTLEELVDFSVRASACTRDELSDDFLELLALMSMPSPRLLEGTACMRDAQDCDAVLTCLGYAVSDACSDGELADDACTDGTTLTRCIWLSGEFHVLETVDCAADGLGNTQCLLTTDGEARCGVMACEADEEGGSCQGSTFFECRDGVVRAVDCAKLGGACVESGSRAGCVLSDNVCEQPHCDGSEVVFCHDELQREFLRIDCATLGANYACVEGDGGARCAVPEDAVECQGNEVTCEGTVARACTGGGWIDFDCASFLNGTCEAIDLDGETEVKCVVSE